MTKSTLFKLLFTLLFCQHGICQTDPIPPPVAVIDYDTAEIDTPLNVTAPGVLNNDTDPNNATLTVTEFYINSTLYTAGQTAIFTEGSLTINPDGSYDFIPAAGYTGYVPVAIYTITNGDETSSNYLFLTVEHIDNLLEVTPLGSCNQGYTSDGEYKIIYFFNLVNTSTARDLHPTSLIRNINITNDLDAVYGNNCVTEITRTNIRTIPAFNYVTETDYPSEFNRSALNSDFLNATSSQVFNSVATDNFILYPRQSVQIQFCVTIDPFCGGRPNPTPSGSGIDFNNIIDVTSSSGGDNLELLLTDFHTTEAVIAAGLHVPEVAPDINTDGTYDFTNTVTITNEGTATANNINFNMGLDNFLNNGVSFNQLTITQRSGPTVSINNSYNGETQPLLLAPNNVLDAGETIILDVFYRTNRTASNDTNFFYQNTLSQTQGALDGFNEQNNPRNSSFVIWSDGLGNHLDRYYVVDSPTTTASSTSQCSCRTSIMRFSFSSSLSISSTITNTDETPNTILEHEAITIELTLTNTSPLVELTNLQLVDDLSSLCSGNVISVSPPTITSSTATTNPTLNPGYNGITDTNIFNGTSGLLEDDQQIVVSFSVVFNEDCISTNTATFSATDPLNTLINQFSNLSLNASTDTDGDGITNTNDLDDDNDGIPDLDEYNGLNPTADADTDFIPNYRDTDFGPDNNGDGIVDTFDFDNDGIANHLDLDSDNDGIFDIAEADNTALDTDSSGRTNNPVGTNGLDDTIESEDTNTGTITYTLPNTDSDPNLNFLDIDADGDGIVDNIEAQTTSGYTPPDNSVNTSGIDSAYPNGITPINTDNDTISDYLDTNSDNDIRNDNIEGWDIDNDGTPEITASNSDNDNDGLDDAYDTDNTSTNPTNGQTPTDFPDVDNTDNPERDWREITAIVIVINNVTATEGNDLNFTISLVTKNDNTITTQSTTPISIDVYSTNGTASSGLYDVATAPFDFTNITSSITIPPLTETGTFAITTIDDIIFEINESLTVNGSITSNNTVNTNTNGIGTITDNDVAPSITMNNSIEDEGIALEHTITLSHPSSTPVIIDVITTDNTANSPEDYSNVSQTLTINSTIDPASANTQQMFSISTNTDNINELDQEVIDVIGTVTTANTGMSDLIKTGTIRDIDPYPTISIEDTETTEGKPLEFVITLLNASLEPMQNFEAINIIIETLDDTARANQDFQPLNLTGTIPALTSNVNQNIITNDDNINESTETMFFSLTNVFNNENTTATGFIKDNDFPNLFSPNNDGRSDVFTLLGIEDYPNFKLTIVDRRGNPIHNYSNNGNLNPTWWDGTNNGKPVPVGVYYYTLDYNDGKTEPKTNFIQIVR